MPKRFAVSLALLVFALAPGGADAGPGGLNLGWGDCQGLPATQNETFSCDTNSGTHVLVGSFVAPCCLTPDAAESVIDLQSEGATLPAWWSLRATAPLGCRSTSLLHSADFTSGPFTCADYWQGAASGGASEDPVTTGNRARIKLLEGLAGGDPLIRPVPEGTEIYVFKCIINNQKTTGFEACGGCDVGVCLVLNTIMINQPAPNDIPYSTPAQRNWVTWQGGIGADCYGATPVKNTTWGTIKALYR